jgi:hypothetical protein
MPRYPHCDARVLHAPGDCTYCDEHPDWQELRETWGINFTGGRDPNKQPCPAERDRHVKSIHTWPGNRPTNVEVEVGGPTIYDHLKEE